MRTALTAFATALTLACCVPDASRAKGPDLERYTPRQTAAMAMAAAGAGELEEAIAFLERARRQQGDHPELLRALARLRFAQGDTAQSEAMLREALAQAPQEPALRAELAALLHRQSRLEAAEHHYELALGGALPGSSRARVERALEAIRGKAGWYGDLSLGLAPSTNVNGGSRADEIEIRGLSFELDEDAQAQSGVGFQAQGMLGHSLPLGSGHSLLVETGGRLLEYWDDQGADDYLAYTSVRLELRQEAILIAPELTLQQRWFDGDAYERAIGPGVSVAYRPEGRIATFGSLAVEALDNQLSDQRDGRRVRLRVGISYGLDARTALEASVTARTERLDQDAFSSTRLGLELGARRDLGGMLLELRAGASRRRFEEPDPLFARSREDFDWWASSELVLAELAIGGFAPRVAYQYDRRHSSIDLYERDAHRFLLGVSRRF